MHSWALLHIQGFRNSGGGDFPGGPVVENLLSIAGDAGSTPGQGTKIPHAVATKPE